MVEVMDRTLDRVERETTSSWLDMRDDVSLTAMSDMRGIIDLGYHVEDACVAVCVDHKRIDLEIRKMLLYKKTIERHYRFDSRLGKISQTSIGEESSECV